VEEYWAFGTAFPSAALRRETCAELLVVWVGRIRERATRMSVSPLRGAKPAGGHGQGRWDMHSEPLRILCVDDDRDAADSEAMLLELHGCEVDVCYDGHAALAAALRFSPDVCLIDFNMPGMDGCEVARRLRAWRSARSLYLIVVTAQGSDEIREETAAAGFDRHLVKPADWDELSLALAELEQRLGRAECLSRARRAAGACRTGLSHVRR
jgi:two-component system, OmpR family, response regulator